VRDARPLRADARRNVAAILDAAEECLAQDTEATMAEIARTAGVGRVTLYGHFPSRAELVEAVFGRVLAEADEALAQVDVNGDPRQAMTRLVSSSWRVVHRYRSLLSAAQRDLPAEDIRDHHDHHLLRLGEVIERGRADGVFRTDVPAGWLTAVCMSLMHTAATEVSAGRLDEVEAAHAVVATVLGACTPNG
jgi:AcrR family transcriptional regulator